MRRSSEEPLRTPDGRYIVVNDRLWRATNPNLSPAKREQLVKKLMAARRSVAAALRAGNAVALRRARRQVQSAKVALGERGPAWWTDGTPHYSRHLVKNTPYAAWYDSRSRSCPR